MNPLDYDPAYPKSPATLAEHIRKYRKDNRLTTAGLSREIGIHKFTLSNWEIRGKVPRIRRLRERLMRAVPGEEGFFLPGR
jgi:DNA-binding transcriptional regulator YiaG